MAMRIRSVKPEFWAHPVMARLPSDVQCMALALISFSDDHGYFEADPRAIRGAVMPYRDDLSTIERDVAELVRIGFIEVRESDGRHIGHVVTFDLHQRVEKPKASKLKVYFDAGRVGDASVTNPGRVHDSSREEGKGREGKGSGKEGIGKGSGRDLDLEGKGETQGARQQKPKRPKPQTELPGVERPARAASLVEQVHEYFTRARAERLEDLGVEVTQDDAPNWPHSAATVSKWAKASLQSEEHYQVSFCKDVIDAYLAEGWPAGCKRRVGGKDTDEPQPYPWHVLLSEKIWAKAIATLAETPLDGVH